MQYKIADAHCDRLSELFERAEVTAENLKIGNVALQIFALFAGSKGPLGDPYGLAQKQLERFYAMIQRQDTPWPIRQTTVAQLPDDYTAAMLSIEGGECLQGSRERFLEFYEQGVRIITLTWNFENELGYPAKTDGAGLKPFGKQMLKEMAEKSIAVDVSHLSERGFWDVESLCGPFMATHSNARALCDHNRNLTDDQIKAIIAHKGFIGANFYPLFLNGSEVEGGATTEDIADHIDHMMQLGGEHVVGFGSDFDGISEHPEGVLDPSGFGLVMEALRKRHYTEQTLCAIAGQNLVDFMQRV